VVGLELENTVTKKRVGGERGACSTHHAALSYHDALSPVKVEFAQPPFPQLQGADLDFDIIHKGKLLE
jgi:hypothetical protein